MAPVHCLAMVAASLGEAVSALTRIFLQEDVNFLVNNRIPRAYATKLMARFSRIESPCLTRISIAIWQAFAGDLRLDEAKKRQFRSLHECFVRELRAGARPVDPDPDVLVSPCDAVVGAFGRIRDTELYQVKGLDYGLGELLNDEAAAERYRNGLFATLRLKSSMYHRFHAPGECRATRVERIAGDTWNVNPIALRRVERLFCRNARAVVDLALPDPWASLTMVAVAAILVAGVALTFLDEPLGLDYRGAPVVRCDAAFHKGQELGHFQSGSTIVLLARGNLQFCPNVAEGATIRMGQPLLRFDRTTDEVST